MLSLISSFFILVILKSINSLDESLFPIRIALAVDKFSIQDIPVVIESVITSSNINTKINDIIFHIVFVSDTIENAKTLLKETLNKVDSCNFGDNNKNNRNKINIDAKPFAFDRDSGFIKQVFRDNSGSKWVSTYATDMVRFHLGIIFPNAPKLLYIDNDVLVTCCLEEVWNQVLDKGTSIGLVTDTIPWSVTTQFARFYNNTHPLFMKGMRKDNLTHHELIKSNPSLNDIPISLEEFNSYMNNRYPNDGVLLIDIKEYNKQGVLDMLREVATANAPILAPGRYGKKKYISILESTTWILSLGSQQFTVLGFHGKWTELIQRSNVRHFPDRARGYMLWYNFNGFIHFAGRLKARDTCARVEAKTMKEMTANRVQSYTPFALTAKKLYNKCDEKVLDMIAARWCSKHLPEATLGLDFLNITLAWIMNVDYRDLKSIESPVGTYHLRIGSPKTSFYPSSTSKHLPIITTKDLFDGNSGVKHKDDDIVFHFEQLLLDKSQFSMAVVDDANSLNQNNVQKSLDSLATTISTSTDSIPPRARINRLIKHIPTTLCGSSSFSDSSSGCSDLIPALKNHSRLEHYDIVTLTVDAGKDSASLLQHFDLTYLRPKLVMIRLGPYSKESKKEMNLYLSEVRQVMKILEKNFFDAYVAQEDDEYGYKLCCPQSVRNNEGDNIICQCIWATRINVLETTVKHRFFKKTVKNKNRIRQKNTEGR